MAQRLPRPGGDNGTWGDILNGFLEVSHNSDGTLSSSAITQAGGLTQSVADGRYVGVWRANTSYSTGQVVAYGSYFYKANSAFTSGSSFSAANWTQMSTGPAGPTGMNWRGVYSNTTTYATNDAVQYNGSAYIATSGVTGVSPGTPSSPTSPWSLVASIGNTGLSGTGVAGVVTPTDLGLLGWTFDAASVGQLATASPYQGQIYGSLISLNATTVTNVTYRVWTAGASLTSGQNFVGLYTSAGSLVASTADQTTNFQTAALHTAAFTSPVAVSTGLYYVAFLANMPASGASLPQFLTAYNGDTPVMNVGNVVRCGQLGNGFSLTSLPSTFTPGSSTANNINFWAVLS